MAKTPRFLLCTTLLLACSSQDHAPQDVGLDDTAASTNSVAATSGTNGVTATGSAVTTTGASATSNSATSGGTTAANTANASTTATMTAVGSTDTAGNSTSTANSSSAVSTDGSATTGALSSSSSGGGSGGMGGSSSSTGGSSTGGNSGASTADTGSTGSVEPEEYQPCPTDGEPCKIMPYGDSITWGVGDEANAGYRAPLFALAVAAQQDITFTGSLSNGPGTVSGQPFPQRNEGHSGWGVSTVTPYSGGNAGIAILIPSPAFDTGSGGVPHIILMMIGTNDATESTAQQMTERLGALMDKIIAAAPDTLLVVAKITPLAWAADVINAYNNAIPGLIDTRAAQGEHVLLADMNTGFNTATMMDADNIHPNAAGYAFMADRWYSVIGPLLP